jgi:hypothetical protein
MDGGAWIVGWLARILIGIHGREQQTTVQRILEDSRRFLDSDDADSTNNGSFKSTFQRLTLSARLFVCVFRIRHVFIHSLCNHTEFRTAVSSNHVFGGEG